MPDPIIVPGSVALDDLDTAKLSRGTLGEVGTQGQAVYLKSADSRLWLSNNSDTEKADLKGILINTAAVGQQVEYWEGGCDLDLGVALEEGKLYVVSDTDGNIQPIDEIGLSKVVTVVGAGTDTGKLRAPAGGFWKTQLTTPAA